MKFFARRINESAVAWSFLTAFLRLGAGVLVLPLIVRTMPPEHLGLWYVFGTLGALATLLDFGFEPTVTRMAAYLWAGARRLSAFGIADEDRQSSGEPNRELLTQLVATLRAYYHRAGVGVFAVLVIGGGAWVWFKTDELPGAGSLRLAWGIYALGSVLNFVSGRWLALLTGIGGQREALQTACVSLLLYYAIAVVGLTLGGGIWALVLAVVSMGILSRSLGFIVFRRHAALPGGIPRAEFTGEVFAAVWPNAWRMGLVSLGGYLILQANTVVCSGYLGLTTTASYGLSFQLTMMLVGISGIWVHVKMPLINQLRVHGHHRQIACVFISRLRITLICYLAGAATILYLAPPVLRFLGSKTELLPTAPLALLLTVQFLEMHHSLYAHLVLSENQNPFLRPALFSGFAILFLSLLATPHFGVWGLIVSAGIVQACFNNWWPVLRAIRGLSIPARDYWRMFFSPTPTP